jgi:ABC-type sugar transport system substrate-binding protein
MPRTVLIVLHGSPDDRQADAYQLLQEEAGREEAKRAGMSAEVLLAPGFDHLRVIRKRLGDPSAPPLDAVVVEPASATSMGLLLKELGGRVGLVFLNAWSPEIDGLAERSAAPLGTVSLDHRKIGQIQARQVARLLPGGGHALCVSGPQRSTAGAERLEGLKSALPASVTLYEAEAGKWTESDSILAFESWYGVYKARSFTVDVIAAASDELAVGARRACEAVRDAAHRTMLSKASLLGVDACPAFGQKLVDSGQLAASIATPATAGEAVRALRRLWERQEPLPRRALVEPRPYPPSSVAAPP